jgi:putative nucleotidyltransferase with HDIG domain
MKRILFVDDEVKILEALQRMLRPQRAIWEMAFAAGSEAALGMLEAAPFDVVVSDMRMPGLDGAALLEIVRAKHPNILRIVLSGYTELEASLRAVPVAHQFLLKPCDSRALRIAIERGTSLLETLNSKLLIGMVGSMQELPSLPRTYSELRTALSDPQTSLDRVVHIVEKDVAISAKVLQLVNSAFFGVNHEVSDIKAAVGYLGMNILQNLVLSVEAFRMFKPSKLIPGFSLEEFHLHSQLVARIAAGIPAETGLPGATLVAGLLHDVGELVIAERAPDHLIRAIEGSRREGRPLHVVEEALIGVSHAEVGAYLLSLWGLPYPIVEAVAHHHHPGRVPAGKLDMIAVIYAADILAHEQLGGAPESNCSPMNDEFLASLHVAQHLPAWRKMAEQVARNSQGA